MPADTAWRLLDANANRAAEGLRVLEDCARFLGDDAGASRRAKDLRHRVRSAIPDRAVACRDTPGDVGTAITVAGEMERARPVDLIRANAARAQEALRAAEESAKLLALSASAAELEQVRYATYALESAVLARLPAWRLWRIRLYALVDTALTADPVGVAAAVARGGAGAVQLRAKGVGIRAYRELAARVQDAVRSGGALFVVNDHAAVAAAIGSDGVHVGQDDLLPCDVRAVVGPMCAIGLSCHTPEQVADACDGPADYLGLGPMHATATKPQEPARGPQLLTAIGRELSRPSYAIGGLDPERVAAIRGIVPHGVAVAGHLCRARDPERAAAELLTLLQGEDD